jgi:N-acyl-D-aspartate/D-glutamate deacylase
MHDIVIRGGTIIDGTGKAAFDGDVAITASASPKSAASSVRLGARSMQPASW